MNTLTNNPRKARKKARELANFRGEPVWCHFASTLTFYLDYIPPWWTQSEMKIRQLAGEIVWPKKKKTIPPKTK